MKVAQSKIIEVVAGPNGSGKSTFARAYLSQVRRKLAYLIRLARGESFAFESTLSGRTYARLLNEARRAGYKVIIYFIFLDSVKRNLTRIRQRVKAGGHDIPKEAVLRRQKKCFVNFWSLYRELTDSWYILDNSGPQPLLVLSQVSFAQMETSEQLEFAQRFAKAGVTNA